MSVSNYSQNITKFPTYVKPVFNLLSEKILNGIKPIPTPKQCPICYRYYTNCIKLDSCTHTF